MNTLEREIPNPVFSKHGITISHPATSKHTTDHKHIINNKRTITKPTANTDLSNATKAQMLFAELEGVLGKHNAVTADFELLIDGDLFEHSVAID